MTNESPFRKNRAYYIGVVLTVLEGILSGCSYLSVYIVLTALASGTITAGMVGAVTAGLVVIFLLRLVIYSTGYTQVQIGGAAVSKRLRLLLGDKLKKIPLARFTQGQVGQYVNTMTSDVGSYEKILTHSKWEHYQKRRAFRGAGGLCLHRLAAGGADSAGGCRTADSRPVAVLPGGKGVRRGEKQGQR